MRIDKAFCDNCGKEDLFKCCPLQLSCGYGSIFDETILDFCSDDCCVEFIIKKQKEVKETGSYNLPLRRKFEEKLASRPSKEKQNG